jgi:hypothetical protein
MTSATATPSVRVAKIPARTANRAAVPSFRAAQQFSNSVVVPLILLEKSPSFDLYP